MGTGALYIKEGIIVKPLKEGGTGSYSHSIDQPDLYPDSLESGTPNGVGIIALGKGIDFINESWHWKYKKSRNEFKESLYRTFKR